MMDESRLLSQRSPAKKVLVLGTTGMLGHTLLRELSATPGLDVRGTARDVAPLRTTVSTSVLARVTSGISATDLNAVRSVLDEFRPDAVINCIGVIKQDPSVMDSANTIAVNSLFPHLLARECEDAGTRLIHVSTDCVFSGDRGGYAESDLADPHDFYGLSKLMGEVTGPSLTLRTSIIGHELTSSRSFIDWFLSSTGTVNGFTKAIYSGVTTSEFARLLATVVIPRHDLTGLIHVASDPISKYEILKLVADEYHWNGEIVPSGEFVCDRSLSASKLLALTGYQPPDWPTMIREMHQSSLPWRNADTRLENA